MNRSYVRLLALGVLLAGACQDNAFIGQGLVSERMATTVARHDRPGAPAVVSSCRSGSPRVDWDPVSGSAYYEGTGVPMFGCHPSISWLNWPHEDCCHLDPPDWPEVCWSARRATERITLRPYLVPRSGAYYWRVRALGADGSPGPWTYTQTGCPLHI